MTIQSSAARRITATSLRAPVLVNGDRMKQREFHRRYEAYHDRVKIELIGGVVYMQSPLRYGHGTYHTLLNFVFGLYQVATPGVEAATDATAILSEESEPQPDLTLRIATEYGGRTRLNEDEYLVGGAELFSEIAYSSRNIDLHQKKDDYEKAGVLEYLVYCIELEELHWFHFADQTLIEPDKKGIYRSRVFPGLWIDGRAFAKQDHAQLVRVLKRGLASRQHTAFVKRLKAEHRKRKSR